MDVQGQGSGVLISEFLAINDRGLRDENGDTSDWIELFNAGTTDVNLAGWYLTDNAGDRTKWRFPSTVLPARSFLVVFASEKNRKEPGLPLHTNFRLGSGGEYLALIQPDGVTISSAFPATPQSANISMGYAFVATTNTILLHSNASARVRIPASDPGDDWIRADYPATNWLAGPVAVGFDTSGNYAPLIRGNLLTRMLGSNATVQVRAPFPVADPSVFNELSLQLLYDDGFIAYLNGQEIGRRNAPASPAWNSTALTAVAAPGPASATVIALSLDGLLNPGTNLLALHGLNVSSNDTDFLLVPLLTARQLTLLTNGAVPLAPTPWAPNSGALFELGPILSNVVHTPAVPGENEDILVTLTALPRRDAIAEVTLNYRVMFGPTIPLPMFDDGQHADRLAGDYVYAASIPAGVSTAGQMVRWFISAKETTGGVSREPTFRHATESAEYFGTVIDPAQTSSKLPVFHLFVAPEQLGAVDSVAGGRASLFHDGEFYDNVSMQLPGINEPMYAKKSHRIAFNREHLLRSPGSEERLSMTSFMADYADPTYMRQGLAFWFCNLVGCPAPFYYPVRLQLNGGFYQLANQSEMQSEALLERLGYDPSGALYKAAGTVMPSQQSAGGFEKQTRQSEGNADYTALANSISATLPLSTRAINVFDRFDIPAVLSYLVAARWVHENNDVGANMSLYHDNDGDGLWRIIPFGMNLSWGAISYETNLASASEGVQATNDLHKAHPLYGTSQALALNSTNYNRIYEAFFLIPQLRQMYLRRLRTVLDNFIGPPQSPAGLLEFQAAAWRDLIAEEALRDRAQWGWPPKGDSSNFDPGISLTNGVRALLDEFIAKRRIHFYEKHSVTNTALAIGIATTNNAGIPSSQPRDAPILISAIEYSPASGNQAEEYLAFRNTNSYAVDLSGWRLEGSVSFTFRPGTVLAGNSVLHVSPNVNAFRARATPPRGGQGLFVVGDYQGQLSARGGSVRLVTSQGLPASSVTYPGSPSAPQQFLRLTEVMYHPALPASSPYPEDEFEFIELLNSGPMALDLAGVHFTNSLFFSFTGASITSLAPGARLLIVRNPEAFAWLYGTNLPVAGRFTNKLDNTRQTLQLDDVSGEDIFEFTYEADRHRITDGAGFSLVAHDESLTPAMWLSTNNWRASTLAGGSPGQPDPRPPRIPRVLVNEVLAHAEPPYSDAIELFNSESFAVDLSGWYLTDDFQQPAKFRVPDGTWIGAGGYLAIDERLFNSSELPPGQGFSFSADGDEVYLFSGDANGQLTGYYHGFSFGATEANVSLSRQVTSSGAEHFVAQSALTFYYANRPPKVGPLIISELMYHPRETRFLIDNIEDEYIELRNITSQAVPLFHASNSNWTWRLARGVNFDLPPLLLPPGGHLLIVSFDPLFHTTQLARFRAKYGVPANVPVLGPYSGRLANGGETLELLKPDATTTNQAVFVLVERIDYVDDDFSDGLGAALRRRRDDAYGNDRVNWFEGLPTPGTAEPSAQAPFLLSEPSSQQVAVGGTATFSVQASGTPPLTYQWFHDYDRNPILNGTNATLLLGDVQLSQGGVYACLVLSPSGVAMTGRPPNVGARLTVAPFMQILEQPAAVTLRGSTNQADYGFTTNQATFSVAATGTGLLRYQWHFNGADLPGATNSSLTILNVGLAHDGLYDVQIVDNHSTKLSARARLKVLVPPTFLQPPLDQIVPSNSSFSVSAVIRGNPPPFRYEWRDVSTRLLTNLTENTTNYFSFGPVTNSVPRSFRVVVFNEANPAPGALGEFTVVAVADRDGDGLTDEWETQSRLNPADPTDAELDSDGDTQSNRAEYLAGTDPNDPASFLKVDQLLFEGASARVSVRFGAVSNRTYTLEVADSALAGPWSRLADLPAAATNRVVEFPDLSATNRVQRFYRVATPRVP